MGCVESDSRHTKALEPKYHILCSCDNHTEGQPSHITPHNMFILIIINPYLAVDSKEV